jgi:fructokinase
VDVIAFGEVLWDVFEVSPRTPGTYKRALGGAPANLAVGLARLGLHVGIIGAVGKDAFGDALTHALAREGVDTRRLVHLPDRTGLAFVHRTARGEPRFLFYRQDTADTALRAHHVRGVRARFAVCGTSTLAEAPLRRATFRFVRLARRSGATLAVDLNVRAHLWSSTQAMRRNVAELIAKASLIKASTADLSVLGGERFVRRHAPTATVLVTAGPGAARAFGAHGTASVRARRARCIDATGAGDAFFAGALAVLVRRSAVPGSSAWSDPAVFSDALAVGHMLGAKVVSSIGAVTGLTSLGDAKRRIGAKR